MSLMRNYLDLITSQHRDKSKYMAMLKALLSLTDDIWDMAIYIDDDFDVDYATGHQLDLIGDIIGQSRVDGFGDEEYRVLQKLKIIKNHWNGKIDDLHEKWKTLFDEPIVIKDNQDMTLSVDIDIEANSYTNYLIKLIAEGYVIPKPMGVGMYYNALYSRQIKSYIGIGILQSGTQKIKTALPTKMTVNHKVGSAVCLSGMQTILPRLDTVFRVNLYSKGSIFMTGRMSIGVREGEL